MKLYNVKSKASSISYAGVLEKVEILSSHTISRDIIPIPDPVTIFTTLL